MKQRRLYHEWLKTLTLSNINRKGIARIQRSGTSKKAISLSARSNFKVSFYEVVSKNEAEKNLLR